jgi:hypothetical protein
MYVTAAPGSVADLTISDHVDNRRKLIEQAIK